MTTALQRIKEYIDYKGISVAAFEKSVGMSNGSFGGQLRANKAIRSDNIESILKSYPELNPNWVFRGEGSMIVHSSDDLHRDGSGTQASYGIPLIPVEAVASYQRGLKLEDTQRYLVPDFRNANFLINVTGDSMYPTYKSGDIIACQYIKEVKFLIWGKPHLIYSELGPIIARVYSGEDEHTILCKSDNENYPPFPIPKTEIRAIALIKGLIRPE